MTYRPLELSEWHQLEPVFAENNSTLPDPRFASILGAFDDNNTIQGFLVLQMQMHAEPLVLFNSHVLNGLMEKADEELRKYGISHYYSFVNGMSEKIAEFYDYQKLPYSVYKKELK